MTLVAGIDVGTSGAKATLVEVEGELASEQRAVTVGYERDGEPSCDPARWVHASLEAVERLGVGQTAVVEGIGFTGQMHAVVALDSEGRPLRRAMLWLDYDGAQQLERFMRDRGEMDMVRRTGNLPLPDFTLAKWLYAVEQTPAVSESAFVLMGAKDYVRMAMCGGPSMTDWNEAAGTQVYDPFNRRWAEEVARAGRASARRLARRRRFDDPRGCGARPSREYSGGAFGCRDRRPGRCRPGSGCPAAGHGLT